MNTISLGYNNNYNYNNNTSSMDDSVLENAKLKKVDMATFIRAIEDYQMSIKNMNTCEFAAAFRDRGSPMYKKISEFLNKMCSLNEICGESDNHKRAYDAILQARADIATRAMELGIWSEHNY